MEELFNGFVEMNDGTGVKSVTIYKDSEGLVYAYVDGDLTDDVMTGAEFASAYGRKLFNDLGDYKKGNSIGVERVWV